MTDKVYLGKSADWGSVYLSKHTWDCDWYWGFGYLGNSRCHFHIESMIDHPKKYESDWTNVSHHFESTWMTQDDWWVLRDLFISAYALKKAAESYRYGGHQTGRAESMRVIDPDMAKRLNADLARILDSIWEYVCTRRDETEK